MKKNLFVISIFLLAFNTNASAKQIQVSVLNFSFSPKNFTANVGDTIHFIWAAGFHTTTSTSVPSGAQSWDQPINNSSTSFLYPVKVAGSYAFQCSFHASMGMVGSFTVTAAATPQNWITTGNSNATASSKLGTTNAIPLGLYTNNVKRIAIDTSGNVGIGIAGPVNILTVKSSGGIPAASWLNGLNSPIFMGFADNVSSEHVLAAASNTSTRRPIFHGRRARGTLDAPAVVANNDFLSSILASGYDGSTFQNPATIDFFVDGAPSSGHVPARISFVTGTNSADRLERLKVGNTGNFNFNNNQLYIQQSDGSIGIGTVAPSAKLDIQNASVIKGINVNNSFTGNEDHTGVYSSSVNNPGRGYGVQAFGGFYGIFSVGQGGSNTGTVIGIYGNATGSAGSRYGVFGTASGGSFNAAGYFNGDVYANTYNNISDRKFKTNIASIKNSVQQIMKLKPSTYVFKSDDIATMGLPSGNQLGLIADEVKQVFPELVKEAVQPAKYGKDRTEVLNPEVKYESVNYIGLIPVLIASTQEQQKQIELQQAQLQTQQQQIDELRGMIKQLSADKDIKTDLNSVSLEQNNPNPLDNFTNISYSIPASSRNAQLVVTDINGKKIKEVQLGSATRGNISFDASALASGTYTYSIIVDSKLTQTKKMIVIKAKDF